MAQGGVGIRIALVLFGIGAAIRFLFAKGDASMEQVGSVMMFLGGVGTLVAALWERWEQRRRTSGPSR